MMHRSGQMFRHSLMARAASTRLIGAAAILVLLWLAIAWAVALP
jgi:hypothetical protein